MHSCKSENYRNMKINTPGKGINKTKTNKFLQDVHTIRSQFLSLTSMQAHDHILTYTQLIHSSSKYFKYTQRTFTRSTIAPPPSTTRALTLALYNYFIHVYSLVVVICLTTVHIYLALCIRMANNQINKNSVDYLHSYLVY